MVCIDGDRLGERRTKRGRKSADLKRQGYYANWKELIQLVIQTVNEDRVICKEGLPIYDATSGKSSSIKATLICQGAVAVSRVQFDV